MADGAAAEFHQQRQGRLKSSVKNIIRVYFETEQEGPRGATRGPVHQRLLCCAEIEIKDALMTLTLSTSVILQSLL